MERQGIMGTRAERVADGRIKLKYLALPGEDGPGLELPDAIARDTIKVLQAILDGERAAQEV